MEIISNGSKWAGESPDALDQLVAVLGSTPLDPTFEEYGNFAHVEDDEEWLSKCPQYRGLWHLSGNFYGVSHVFSIRGTHEELAHVIDAIRVNQQTAEYAEAKREIVLRNETRRAEEESRRIKASVAAL